MPNKNFIRTGTAIIEMDRIRKLCSNSKFLARFFSADEIRYIVSRELSTSIIAENYCAKIEFAKAIGTGMRIVKPSEISILRDRLGSPLLITEGRAKMLEERENYIINLSVAHCKSYATASVIITKGPTT